MIYTAIVGGRDPSRSDIHCFTGEAGFKSPRMNAKIYKVLPHHFLRVPWSIWVDGNIFPKVPHEIIVRELLSGADIAFFRHPYRRSVAEELALIQQHNLGAEDNRLEGFSANYPLETYPLFEGGIILRRHNPAVAQFNEHWWALICRYSGRDQLTLPIAMRDSEAEVQFKVIECNLREHWAFDFVPHGL